MPDKIMLVEDEYIVALDIRLCLEELGYEVVATLDKAELVLSTAQQLQPDLVLMDIHLAGSMRGTDAALLLHHHYPLPVIFLTANSETDILQHAELSMPYGFLIKPYDKRELAASIRMALNRARATPNTNLLAYQDPLTQLGNRAKLDLQLPKLCVEANPQQQLGIIFLDLDNFKPINDHFGHAAGDHVLQTVGLRLQQGIRHSDFAYRFGGDEFVVLLPQLPSQQVLEQIAQKLLQLLQQPMPWQQHQLVIGASIGAVLTSGQQHTPNQLLQVADHTMYQAKAMGKNQLLIHHAEHPLP